MVRSRFLVLVGAVFLLAVLGGCLHVTGEETVNITTYETIETTDNRTGNISDGRLFSDTAASLGFNYSDDYTFLLEGVGPSGVYISDYDNDDRPDILALGSRGPRLFVNSESGFIARNLSAEVSKGEFTTAHFFDHDNDGYDDLYLMSNNDSVFLENVEGEFIRHEVGLEVGYDSVRGAATADYTGNGCLDVFVVQSNNWQEHRAKGYREKDVAISDDNGNPNRLFAGDCETFKETTEEAGIKGEAWSLATSFVDFTNDGRPDIHVANDFNNDVMYFNNGDGTFERHVMPEFTNRNGMSSEVADVDGDGFLDIFVTNIYYPEGDVRKMPDHRYGGRLEGNNLLLNQGNGTFRDAAVEYGVKNSTGWGWAAVFADFHNDGHLDLSHSTTGSTGGEHTSFWKGSEEGFVRWESNRTGMEKTRGIGMAALDYNLDGRVDIAESNQRGSYRLYENFGSGDGGWLQVDVENDGRETEIGSRVEVTTSEGTETQVVDSGSDYLSQDTRLLHFGLGSTEAVDVRVEWPNGVVRSYENVSVGQRIIVTP